MKIHQKQHILVKCHPSRPPSQNHKYSYRIIGGFEWAWAGSWLKDLGKIRIIMKIMKFHENEEKKQNFMISSFLEREGPQKPIEFLSISIHSSPCPPPDSKNAIWRGIP